MPLSAQHHLAHICTPHGHCHVVSPGLAASKLSPFKSRSLRKMYSAATRWKIHDHGPSPPRVPESRYRVAAPRSRCTRYLAMSAENRGIRLSEAFYELIPRRNVLLTLETESQLRETSSWPIPAN